MRWVCYLGTRGCSGVLADALRDNFGPVEILVPAEPRLLGPHLSGAGLEDALADVAGIVAEQARRHAVDVAERNEAAAAGVFETATAAGDRIEAVLLDPPLEDALAERAGGTSAEVCYVSRDTLDLLDEAGIRPAEALDPHGVELVTR